MSLIEAQRILDRAARRLLDAEDRAESSNATPARSNLHSVSTCGLRDTDYSNGFEHYQSIVPAYQAVPGNAVTDRRGT